MSERGNNGGGWGEVKCVSDMADIVNVLATVIERKEICLEKDRIESMMKPRFFCRESWCDRLCSRQRKRQIDYLDVT